MKPYHFLIYLLFLIGCNNEENKPIDFYYWRSNFSLNKVEIQAVKDYQVQNLYVRLFDVDRKEIHPQPIGVIKNFDASLLDVNYIPTVFITNRTFQSLNTTEVKKLAINVNQLINEISTAGKLKDYNEIQIDCDWTKSTRESYFYFLEELKKVSKKNISATLRLHQVKFKDREGVPPLDKMVLMCYATENPSEVEYKNSILDVDLAKNYLQNLEDYPIVLDVALPIYSWAIITNHLGQIKLINSFTPKDLQGKPVKSLGNGMYEVEDDFFIEKFYVSKGFKIKIETITAETLTAMKQFINRKLEHDYRLIYYHLDQRFISNYNLNNL